MSLAYATSLSICNLTHLSTQHIFADVALLCPTEFYWQDHTVFKSQLCGHWPPADWLGPTSKRWLCRS